MSDDVDQLRELGTQLPWDRPDAARRDAVRSSLLVEAVERAARPTTRWYAIGGAFAAGALAAAAALLMFVHDKEPAPVASAAHIEASPSAQLSRQVTRTPTGLDEVVRVRAGTVSMSVGALRAGDHVRVATRDAEVEGEGSYAVVVVADELHEVNVADGRATIRVTGQQAVFLSAGQSWSARAVVAHADLLDFGPRAAGAADPAPVPAPAAVPAAAVPVPAAAAPVPAAAAAAAAAPVPVPAAAAAPVPAPAPAPAPPVPTPKRPSPKLASRIPDDVSAPAPAPATPVAIDPTPAPTSPTAATAPTAPTEVERRFQSGIALLKSGKAAEAARELLAAADAGGDDPLAADARYFAATALTKAGRKTEAERTLVAFIDGAPKSIRRGRAAVMLARLIAERGDSASARAWFESALTDPDANVVAAARAGIAALK